MGALFGNDVVTELNPYLTADPEIRIDECLDDHCNI